MTSSRLTETEMNEIDAWPKAVSPTGKLAEDRMRRAIVEIRRSRSDTARIMAVLDPLLDPVTPEATEIEMSNALTEIVHILWPERSLRTAR